MDAGRRANAVLAEWRRSGRLPMPQEVDVASAASQRRALCFDVSRDGFGGGSVFVTRAHPADPPADVIAWSSPLPDTDVAALQSNAWESWGDVYGAVYSPLCGLRSVTAITARHASRQAVAYDLGGDVVAYAGRAPGETVAVDVAHKRQAWTLTGTAPLARVDGEVWWKDDDGAFVVRDPATGAVVRARADEPTAAPPPPDLYLHRRPIRVALVEYGSGNYGAEGDIAREITLTDVGTGARVLTIDLPEMSEATTNELCVVRDRIVLANSDYGVFAYDLSGALVWRRDGSASSVWAHEGGHVLVGGRQIEVLDAVTGRLVTRLAAASVMHAIGPVLVCAAGRQVVAFDRATFAERWRCPETRYAPALEDGVLVFTEHPPDGRGWQSLLVDGVRIVDPLTGTQLAEVDLRGHGAQGPTRLVGSRLVFLSTSGGPPVIVVD